MNKRLATLLAPLLSFSLASHAVHADNEAQSAPVASSTAYQGVVATVQIGEIGIGLVKPDDGTTWDGSVFGGVAAVDLKNFLYYTSLRNVAGIAATIGSASIKHMQKPDPVGTYEVFLDGRRVFAGTLGKTMHTYRVSWSKKLSWMHIPLDRDVRIVIHLDDYDRDLFSSDDAIGTVVLNVEHLRYAAGLGQVWPVFVGDQTQNAIAYINLNVVPETTAQ